MTANRSRISRIAFPIIELCASFVFLWAVAYHVVTFDFKPLAGFCVPILVLFFGFASLLYNRGRSLAKGKAQIRSLYAAERATQATIWYLFGIIVGITVYGILMYFGITFDWKAPTPAGLWLLLFVVPFALMEIGFVSFMRAVWIITPQFFRRTSPFELQRRI